APVASQHQVGVDVGSERAARSGRDRKEVECRIEVVQSVVGGEVLEVDNLAKAAQGAEVESRLDRVVAAGSGAGQPAAERKALVGAKGIIGRIERPASRRQRGASQAVGITAVQLVVVDDAR